MAEAIEKLPSSVSGLREEVKNYFSKWQAARSTAQRVAKENERRIEGVIETVETVGMAFAVSWFSGKNAPTIGGVYQVMGHDVDLVAGAALIGLGLFELGGKYDEHFYSLGAGALSAWATRQGFQTGQRARQALPATAATTGVAPASSYTAGVAPAGSYQHG